MSSTSLQPSWNKTSGGQNFSLGYTLEKVLYQDEDFMPRFSVGVFSAWHYQWPKNSPDQHGFDDLNAVCQVGVLRFAKA